MTQPKPTFPAIEPIPTAVTAFLGRASAGPVNDPTEVASADEFERVFGVPDDRHPMGRSVRDFFANGGRRAIVSRPLPAGDPTGPLTVGDYLGSESDKTGIFALDKADLFNLLCIPPDRSGGNTEAAVYQAALAYCVKRRAMLIVDPPAEWGGATSAVDAVRDGLASLGLHGEQSRNAALYFPRVVQSDPGGSQPIVLAPSGIVAGIFARVDRQRGVWAAPAGLGATAIGIDRLQVTLTDTANGLLTPLGVNCLRTFPLAGHVVWGARTLRGDDRFADEYKYVPVRRLALHIEDSIDRGLDWIVNEPNEEATWAQVRLSVGAFLHDLFRQGAFRGRTPAESYFVRCDRDTTTQDDIDNGRLNIIVGMAPLKPAEFVHINLQRLFAKDDPDP